MLFGTAAMAAQVAQQNATPQPPVFALGSTHDDHNAENIAPVKEQQSGKKLLPKISSRRSDTVQVTPKGRTGTSWLFFRPLWRASSNLIEAK